MNENHASVRPDRSAGRTRWLRLRVVAPHALDFSAEQAAVVARAFAGGALKFIKPYPGCEGGLGRYVDIVAPLESGVRPLRTARALRLHADDFLLPAGTATADPGRARNNRQRSEKLKRKPA